CRWSRRTPRCPTRSPRGRSRFGWSGPSPAANGRSPGIHIGETVMGMETTPVSTKALWAGRIVSALPVLMLVMSGVMKLVRPAPVVESFTHLGYPEGLAVGIGVLELVCTAVYLN